MNGRHGRHGESRSAVVRRQKDEQGADEYRVMRIDVVATIPRGRIAVPGRHHQKTNGDREC